MRAFSVQQSINSIDPSVATFVTEPSISFNVLNRREAFPRRGKKAVAVTVSQSYKIRIMPRMKCYTHRYVLFMYYEPIVHLSAEKNTRCSPLTHYHRLTRVNCPLIWHIPFARGLSRSGSFLIASIRSRFDWCTMSRRSRHKQRRCCRHLPWFGNLRVSDVSVKWERAQGTWLTMRRRVTMGITIGNVFEFLL